MSTPRSDPLALEVVDLIGTVVARYHEEYAEAATRHHLTVAQARVLALLATEPAAMRSIARQLRCEPSNVTGIIDRLEARGLVERLPDPVDRRVRIAAATDEGHRTARDLGGAPSFAREALAELSAEELGTLRDLLRRIPGCGGTDV
ncbi:MarR family winged helix-turn-helix transcriptional regulator [Streptomyces pacificus]|uniref:MarR family transcriptional regulator n=1 Tax=Streptomyces pacificus TaxID=2705029 RepID=A0A6A0APL7_9ACTN|nr:MarR family transcriptional regulator [Streptomyces pacificus]GFH34233.1 MarR family transcriptional regulator [Streptomyces pacificus]